MSLPDMALKEISLTPLLSHDFRELTLNLMFTVPRGGIINIIRRKEDYPPHFPSPV